MTTLEEQAIETITRLSMNPSGPVMRPASELVAYAHVLECVVGSMTRMPADVFREYIAPHWVDVLADMEVRE